MRLALALLATALIVPVLGEMPQAHADAIVWNSERVMAYSVVPVTRTPSLQAITQAMYDTATGRTRGVAMFGREGVASADLSAFTKWTDVLGRMQQADAAAPSPQVTQWLTFLDSLRGQSRDQQLAAVNEYMNHIAYISDQENYGVADYWATPAEFLARGGDCEDYAIAKYASLKILGFDVSQMQVVVLYNQERGERHAVLAMENEGHTLILDNLSQQIADSASLSNYQPIYAISQYSWYRYV